MKITKTIHNIRNTILMSLGLVILGTSAIPGFSIAADEDCNKYGGTCHVSEINTLHTKDEKKITSKLLDTIKNAINRILGILATIALVICMYGGFRMLTSGSNTSGYDAGLKVLKNAAIGLAIILLAWMIVSVIFRFVGTLSGGNQTQGSELD